MSALDAAPAAKPAYVTALEAVYGEPSQAGFGSAVFFDTPSTVAELAGAALAKYRYFVGELWARYGEDAWMGPWKQVYARPADAAHDIIAELRAIDDGDAAISVPMILENVENAEQGRAALRAAFDGAAVTEVAVFNLGDGGAMSGLLVAGARAAEKTAVFLVFLMD